jgi:hypothetical protein
LRAATKVATRQGWRCRQKSDEKGRHDLFEDEKRYQDRIAANARARGMHVVAPGSKPCPGQPARLAELERRTSEREQARQQVMQDLLAQYDALKKKLEKLEIERDEIKAGIAESSLLLWPRPQLVPLRRAPQR